MFSYMVQKVSQLCNKEFTEDAKHINRLVSHPLQTKGQNGGVVGTGFGLKQT